MLPLPPNTLFFMLKLKFSTPTAFWLNSSKLNCITDVASFKEQYQYMIYNIKSSLWNPYLYCSAPPSTFEHTTWNTSAPPISAHTPRIIGFMSCPNTLKQVYCRCQKLKFSPVLCIFSRKSPKPHWLGWLTSMKSSCRKKQAAHWLVRLYPYVLTVEGWYGCMSLYVSPERDLPRVYSSAHPMSVYPPATLHKL